jgi:hypothetical protein
MQTEKENNEALENLIVRLSDKDKEMLDDNFKSIIYQMRNINAISSRNEINTRVIKYILIIVFSLSIICGWIAYNQIENAQEQIQNAQQQYKEQIQNSQQQYNQHQ